MSSRQTFAIYVRNFIFGVEDSLVSTVGLLAGVASAGVPKHTIILTGMVLIFVEAFSMAVGSFLSEQSAEEFIARSEMPLRRSAMGGVIMFISYFVAGFIPLLPYLFAPTASAFTVSIVLSLVTLFLLGAVSARVFKISILKHGFRMLAIGGIAIGVGIVVGRMVQTFSI